MAGGRKPEDFPEARKRDRRVLALLRRYADTGLTRNSLAHRTGDSPLKIRYSLNRLRNQGLVEHIRKGREGHGYWAVVEKETETDES